MQFNGLFATLAVLGASFGLAAASPAPIAAAEAVAVPAPVSAAEPLLGINLAAILGLTVTLGSECSPLASVSVAALISGGGISVTAGIDVAGACADLIAQAGASACGWHVVVVGGVNYVGYCAKGVGCCKASIGKCTGTTWGSC